MSWSFSQRGTRVSTWPQVLQRTKTSDSTVTASTSFHASTCESPMKPKITAHTHKADDKHPKGTRVAGDLLRSASNGAAGMLSPQTERSVFELGTVVVEEPGAPGQGEINGRMALPIR